MEPELLRAACQADLADICRLWELSFGDAPETVKKLLKPEMLENTTVLELGGHVRSLMAAFDSLDFGGVKASYIFALCTDPELRGRGLGERVLRETALRAFERGAELVCLHPASESLARWYAKLGLTTFSRVFVERLGTDAAPGLSLKPVSAWEYAALRGDAALRVPAELLGAQELFYGGDDGGFFAFEAGCACVQRTENGPELRELICPEGQKTAMAAAVSARFGGSACLPRVIPADSERGSTHLMGLRKGGAERAPATPIYLPFLLD